MLSRRLSCDGVDYEFSQQMLDHDHFEEEDSFPCYKQYYREKWHVMDEYPVSNDPRSFLRISRWLELIRYFPHPIFSRW